MTRLEGESKIRQRFA